MKKGIIKIVWIIAFCSLIVFASGWGVLVWIDCTSRAVSYEYESLGIEFWGWKRESTLGKVEIYKEKAKYIDLGIRIDGEIFPFGDDAVSVLKQNSILVEDDMSGVFCVRDGRTLLYINLQRDDDILYDLTVCGNTIFVLLKEEMVIDLPVYKNELVNLFGGDFIDYEFPCH